MGDLPVVQPWTATATISILVTVTDAAATRRPGGVTVVVVLTYISGVLSVIAGVVAVVVGIGSSVATESRLLVGAGIATIIIGVITLILAGGLRAGRNVARIVVSIVMVLQLISAVLTDPAGTASRARRSAKVSSRWSSCCCCGARRPTASSARAAPPERHRLSGTA